MYLRRQDQQSVSLYSTRLRRGASARLLSTPYDYARALTNWAEVFGRAAVTPRIYERASLVDGDAVADFIAAAELAAAGVPPPGKRDSNPSLQAPAQELLRLVGEAIDPESAGMQALLKSTPYRVMRNLLELRFQGTGRLPARAEAIAFYETCRESNERVRREWFPDRPTLFAEDFDRYPETATPRPATEDVLRIAVAVIARILGEADRPRRAGRARRRRKAAAT